MPLFRGADAVVHQAWGIQPSRDLERLRQTDVVGSERVFRAGPLGHGHAMKALNNFVACAGEVAALDAMMIGARFGLDVETMLDVFNAGTGRNFVTEHVLVDEGLSRRYGTGFQLALMVKDMGIAAHLAEGTGFETTWPAQARDRMAAALAALGDPAADHSRALEYWESLAGVELAGADDLPGRRVDV